MAYNSKYTGAEVDAALDKARTALQSIPPEYVTDSELAGKGYATMSSLNNKVDKVDGKQLSTEDFTTLLKNKLEGLDNYDDSEIEASINKLRRDFDALVSGDTTTAIKTFNEVIAFLNGIQDTQNLSSIIASIEQQIASKQDAISDLANIRAGAAKGATALQSHQDISGKLDKTDAASTYLTKTDAASTYLGKNAKAADSAKSDSATKATQDGSGNVITATYATKTELSGKVDKVSGKGLSTNDYTTGDKTKLGYTNIAYGTCDTAEDIAEKAITINGNSNWELQIGSIIVIKFSATNKAENPTFNVNNKGAKSVWYNTAIITTGSLSYAGYANRPMEFMYDGTQYVFIGWSADSNTTYSQASLGQGYGTCSTDASTTEKAVSLSSYSLTTGGIVSVKFTYDVPASATLNINSKGAKAIYHQGAKIKNGVIKAGDVATFIYKTYYYLIATDRAASVATISKDGLMSSSDKSVLDSVSTTYATKTEVGNKQDKVLKFTNKSASTWVGDSTYSSFPYRCDISCSGVTADMYAEVVFNIDESTSGNYAPVCETKANIVSIWSSENESITIPTIIITK